MTSSVRGCSRTFTCFQFICELEVSLGSTVRSRTVGGIAGVTARFVSYSIRFLASALCKHRVQITAPRVNRCTISYLGPGV